MIALGCDHGGYELKQEIIKYLEERRPGIQGFWMRQSTDSYRLSGFMERE